MKICLIGDKGAEPNEGMQNISRQYINLLSRNHDVIAIHPRSIRSPRTLKRLKQFSPEIIHYIHGPSVRSLLILKFLKTIVPSAKTVISAPNPRIGKIGIKFLPLLKPAWTLAQSRASESAFRDHGFAVSFLPNGVNLKRFTPIGVNDKWNLRDQHGIQREAFVILHVGHIRTNRNLEIFKTMASLPEIKAVVIGAAHFPSDKKLEKDMRNWGCLVFNQYYPEIQQFYSMADCFVFPTKPNNGSSLNRLTGSIEIPLSVLEACASNLIILATPYGGLPDLFSEGEGFYFFRTAEELVEKLRRARKGTVVRTRSMVEKMDWENIIKELEFIYRNLVIPR